MTDYYKILGLERSASDEDIRTAYRKLAKAYHPDKNSGDQFFEKMFKQINDAYETLSNPQLKSDYDAKLSGNANSKTKDSSSKLPIIEYLIASRHSFSIGDEISFEWRTFNADYVVLMPFGRVESTGKKIYKINKSDAIFDVILTARNTKTDKETISKIVLLKQSTPKLDATIIERKKNNDLLMHITMGALILLFSIIIFTNFSSNKPEIVEIAKKVKLKPAINVPATITNDAKIKDSTYYHRAPSKPTASSAPIELKKYGFVVLVTEDGYRQSQEIFTSGIAEFNDQITEDEKYKILDYEQTEMLKYKVVGNVLHRDIRIFDTYSEASRARESLLGVNSSNVNNEPPQIIDSATHMPTP